MYVTVAREDGECQPANDQCRHVTRKVASFNGPLMLSNRASANSLSAPIRSSGVSRDSLEDKSKVNVVQVGRFSVTSGTVDLVKVSPLRKSASVGDWLTESRSLLNSQPPMEVSDCAIPTSFIMPQLHNLLQQTAFQQKFQSEQCLIPCPVPECGISSPQTQSSENDELAEMITTERECLLLDKISELQSSIFFCSLLHGFISAIRFAATAAVIHFKWWCRRQQLSGTQIHNEKKGKPRLYEEQYSSCEDDYLDLFTP
ncbi:hypothetical protein ACLOJK_004949 [Asimina triloba]